MGRLLHAVILPAYAAIRSSSLVTDGSRPRVGGNDSEQQEVVQVSSERRCAAIRKVFVCKSFASECRRKSYIGA